MGGVAQYQTAAAGGNMAATLQYRRPRGGISKHFAAGLATHQHQRSIGAAGGRWLYQSG